MAQELLRYRPGEAGKEEWLLRIEELINTAGTAPSRDLVLSYAAPPPPLRGGALLPPPPSPPRRGPALPHTSSPDCQIIQWAPVDGRVGIERNREHQNRGIRDIVAAGCTNRATGVGVTAFGAY